MILNLEYFPKRNNIILKTCLMYTQPIQFENIYRKSVTQQNKTFKKTF